MAIRFELKNIATLILFWLFTPALLAQESSVLADGQWVKMTFQSAGVYKIDKATLTAMGFDTNNLDPKKLAIYGNRGGMLPQPLATPRANDLIENAIYVTGEDDDIFNAEDYLLFYVDRPNELVFDPSSRTFQIIKNLYSNEINYFLTLKNDAGLRLKEKPNMGTDLPEINFYNQIIDHELDEVNIMQSGREWFGEDFNLQPELSFKFNIQGLAANKEIIVQTEAVGQALNSSYLNVSVNNQALGQLSFPAIPNSRYGIKGYPVSKTFTFNASSLAGSEEINLQFSFDNQGVSTAEANLDKFLIDIPTDLSYHGKVFSMRSTNSLEQSLSTFKVTNANPNLQIWDVTSPTGPENQAYDLIGTDLRFGAFTDELHEYVVFEPSTLPMVVNFQPVENQNLHGVSVPDMVIISADEFLTEANRLASFRTANDGLSVLVTTPEKIYNEFSSGRQDITAIRDFMYFLKEKGNSLQYLLLFGKGSYDYKDRIEGNTNFVPTYESRSSLQPLTTYSSDDYFGFLDQDEGEWVESSAGDHLLYIGIGRIPSTTIEQATTAVDKIIHYQTSSNSIGDWRRRLLFVADDGDNNLHQRDADQLATLVDTSFAAFNVRKLYLDAYEQVRKPNGETSPTAEKALLDAVDQGVLIMNFTGHGAETGWTQEEILTLETIDEWKNPNRLPLLVTATCEFGRNDDPKIFSGAEKVMFKADGGAIGLITTARPVFSSSNYALNLALYGSILKQPGGNFQRLGDVIRYTKNNALNGPNNRNFILLGDPSMRLSYPENEIVISSINNKAPQAKADTLKALQQVNIQGQIESAGQLITNFNGELNFTLMDKRNLRQTLGSEGSKFEYFERDSQLFNGIATVHNGTFSIDFTVPKNINYQFGQGKMSMYASEENNTQDAFGAKIDFILGGTSTTAAVDNLAPTIKVFLNDSTNTGHFIVKRDANLFLKLYDESGINISESGLGQNLSATLNDSITYNLNGFYSSQIDNYKKGEVLFPLRNLPLGTNTIEARAWDNHNNLTKATIVFQVTDENSTLITEINTYPNPFVSNTTFSVSHNCAGEALELAIHILKTNGEKVTSLYSEIEKGSNTEKIEWDGTDNSGSLLSKGVYLYNVVLKSKNSGKTHAKRRKLIISY